MPPRHVTRDPSGNRIYYRGRDSFLGGIARAESDAAGLICVGGVSTRSMIGTPDEDLIPAEALGYIKKNPN